jgi:hypothetical protein
MLLSVAHPDQLRPGALADPQWVPVHLAGILVTPLALFGWLAIYAQFRTAFGTASTLLLGGVLLGIVSTGVDQAIELTLPSYAVNPRTDTVSGVADAAGEWVAWARTLTSVTGLAGAIVSSVVAFNVWRAQVRPRLAWLGLAIFPVGGILIVVLAAAFSPDSAWPTIVTLGVVAGFLYAWIGLEMTGGAADKPPPG